MGAVARARAVCAGPAAAFCGGVALEHLQERGGGRKGGGGGRVSRRNLSLCVYVYIDI